MASLVNYSATVHGPCSPNTLYVTRRRYSAAAEIFQQTPACYQYNLMHTHHQRHRRSLNPQPVLAACASRKADWKVDIQINPMCSGRAMKS